MAARLKTFDPTTTPTLTPCAPFASATSAEEISGLSAARAVRTPTRASGMPTRVACRSSRRAKVLAANKVTAADTRNRSPVTAGGSALNAVAPRLIEN